jgi:hypothetical protein
VTTPNGPFYVAGAPAGAPEPCFLNGTGDGPGERGPDGRFLTGNQVARRVGLYARQQPEGLREDVERLTAGIVADLGGEGELSTLERAYVNKIGDVEITLRLLAHDIARRGLLTPSGGVRHVFDSLLAGIDRVDRLAQRLGMRRRSKHVDLARTLSGQEGDGDAR